MMLLAPLALSTVSCLHCIACVTFTGCTLPGGEMPAPTAAVIYFIRTAVIRHLPEQQQRSLLSALARATSHAIAPPVIIAALECCGVLLELLGALVQPLALAATAHAMPCA